MTQAELIVAVAVGSYCLLNACYPLAVLTFLCSERWKKPLPDANEPLPPVTLLRPLKAGVPALREKLDSLAAALRPGDQLVLGVNEGSNEERVGAEVCVAFPGREITVVACAAGVALNPKISKLLQMAPRARHERWILSDSETLIDDAWLDGFRREWLTSRADALTAGYRFVNLASWPQRLDAGAALLALWPGLAMVQRQRRVDFTLGACTGFRRSDVEAVGGWSAFGDFLAEDNRLGAALSKAGRMIRLSTLVATLESDPLTWRDYWRHQRRVAVTYRVCRPAGFAGMILTNKLVALAAWALLVTVVPMTMPALKLVLGLGLIAAVRWGLSLICGRTLRFSIPWLFPVMIAASAVELACWVATWCDRRVWWAGWRWQVSRNGRLRPLG